MPRFRTTGAGGPPAGREFDLCARCSGDGDVLRTVVASKLGESWPASSPPPIERVPHRSYDFQSRPVQCLSCARILGSEDD